MAVDWSVVVGRYLITPLAQFGGRGILLFYCFRFVDCEHAKGDL